MYRFKNYMTNKKIILALVTFFYHRFYIHFHPIMTWSLLLHKVICNLKNRKKVTGKEMRKSFLKSICSTKITIGDCSATYHKNK